MCDVAYVLRVGQVERQALADQQKAVTLIAAGAKRDDIPEEWLQSFDERQAAFDVALVAEPVAVSPREQLLRDLGLVA